MCCRTQLNPMSTSLFVYKNELFQWSVISHRIFLDWGVLQQCSVSLSAPHSARSNSLIWLHLICLSSFVFISWFFASVSFQIPTCPIHKGLNYIIQWTLFWTYILGRIRNFFSFSSFHTIEFKSERFIHWWFSLKSIWNNVSLLRHWQCSNFLFTYCTKCAAYPFYF